MCVVEYVVLDAALWLAQWGMMCLQGTGRALHASVLPTKQSSVVSGAAVSHRDVTHRCACLLTRAWNQLWQVPEGQRRRYLAEGQQLHENEMVAAVGHCRMLTRHAAQSEEY